MMVSHEDFETAAQRTAGFQIVEKQALLQKKRIQTLAKGKAERGTRQDHLARGFIAKGRLMVQRRSLVKTKEKQRAFFKHLERRGKTRALLKG